MRISIKPVDDMKILDNITNTVRDDLRVEIKKGSRVSIAAACFSMYAYKELKKQLETIDEFEFIFTSPTFVKEKAEKQKREFYIPRISRETSLYGTEFEIKLRNEMTQRAIAKECADWIRRKATFKSNTTGENMAGFMTVDSGAAQTAYMPIGGFTTVDIGCERGNNSYNMVNCMEAPFAQQYMKLFDTLWNDRDKMQDVTDLKLTRHNGRAGAHGTYNPKHNDRSFNLANSEHIDPERAKGNIYWDCFHGFRSALDPQDPDDLAATFSDVERQFYETHYTAFIESQNERNAKIRHTERNRSIPDLLSSRKTCPEETIYQLGTLDEHASAEDLLSVVTEFIEKFKAKYGDHVHVLDWALHLDESTPHIHERHVFDCENKYGEVAPQQEKALEALGFDLPDPDKPLSRRNNRKITFDAACRKMLFEIAKRHGLDLEEEAEYGNRKYLEKQDFILAKQKEQLAAQQSKLDELTLKVNDMETLIDEVSAAAYDKAVEVVTDVVRTETRKEDMQMIEDTKKWVLSPERKAPQPTREYAAHRLDTVLDKFLKTMQTTAARLQEKLLKPEVRQKGKEQVKEKARDSVLQLLSRLQAEQAQRNPSVLSTAEKSENRFQ